MHVLTGCLAAAQNEKSYQKQASISLGGRNSKLYKQKNGKNMRWSKTVGLGFKTPREALEGNYVDKKCPFTGNVSIRGKILTGVVTSSGKVRIHPPPAFFRCMQLRRGACRRGGCAAGRPGFCRKSLGRPSHVTALLADEPHHRCAPRLFALH